MDHGQDDVAEEDLKNNAWDENFSGGTRYSDGSYSHDPDGLWGIAYRVNQKDDNE